MKGIPLPISDQMERVIPCKHQCRTKLSKLDLKPVDDIVANIYHHLQYAYSKGNDEHQLIIVDVVAQIVLKIALKLRSKCAQMYRDSR